MYSDFIIGSWASLRGRCTTRHTVNDDNSVEFSFRNGAQSLDLEFDAQGLESFVSLAQLALRQMRELPGHPPS